jgi:antitoxin (DNA-binding transcriptional repressor) of toxin-antitoxin stability system
MGIFATLVRRGAHAEATVDAVPARDVSQWGLPARFEAVGERLAAGQDASSACALVGRETARDGADLGEALDGLRATYARVQGGEPDFRALRALSVAWSEETLGYLHQLSCEDPLTGLASLAHVRARLSEVYRGAEQGEQSTSTSHALVVVDVPPLARRPLEGGRPDVGAMAGFESALWLARLADYARMVFPGGETIGLASPSRLVVVAERGDLLAARVGLLRGLVEDMDPGGERARVWIEGLPPSDDGAGLLLDEIARS